MMIVRFYLGAPGSYPDWVGKFPLMYLYILVNSISAKYYIGTTVDLSRRLREHNSNNNHFTGRTAGNWEVLFSKWFNSKIEARREEIRLKKAKNKKYIDWYISNPGP